MRILLITPPMTQVNTPYPATPYLTGYLKEQGFNVEQRDLGLDLFHKLFCEEGLRRIFDVLKYKKKRSESEEFFIDAFDDYLQTITPVLRFLMGGDSSLALRLSRRQLVPEGPRFLPLQQHPELLAPFGVLGTQDQAKYIASLYLDDIADVIRNGVDFRFEFSKYGEQLASSQASLTPLIESLNQQTIIDQMIEECILVYFEEIQPNVVGFTIPFPGNVYGALRAARCFKKLNSEIKTLAGGGFVNTELRELSDPRLFEFMDYLTFDDGEWPIHILLEHLQGQKSKKDLVRTWYLEKNEIQKSKGAPKDVPFKKLNGPTYKGLSLKKYVSMLEMPNPMHRMWSDFRWNKMILAHGCYWKKCTFCDISLDYISRFEPARVEILVDNIERIISETQQSGFHFVDEAAPPALLKNLSEELIKRKIKITWWGNLRFDKQFTLEVAQLMADAGCVAVTGGLEVASPRVLKLINKGTTLENVAQVTRAFTDAGIYVHAYLMYGFPSQTEQETIDSLEVVRQLFVAECLHSAHWHRFVATAHSPVGRFPEKFGVQLRDWPVPHAGLFAKNAIPFLDSVACDHDRLGEGLRKALYNYMHGIGLKQDVRSWFNHQAPKTTLKKKTIEHMLIAESAN